MKDRNRVSEQHRHPEDPVPLAPLAAADPVLVRAGEEDPHQVQEDHRHHQVRGQSRCTERIQEPKVTTYSMSFTEP